MKNNLRTIFDVYPALVKIKETCETVETCPRDCIFYTINKYGGYECLFTSGPPCEWDLHLGEIKKEQCDEKT